ncbi:hypothetical protein KR018_008998, partial [Drosophila ironensis]
CVDYRLLNERSEKDAYPLPRMNHILEQLREAKFISSLDLKNGYWQIPMEGGEELLGDGEGVFGDRLGDWEDASVSGGKWLNSIQSPAGRIARWALQLQQYDFEIVYRKGKLNVVADALSRQPLADERCGIAKDAVQREEEPGEDGWIGEMLEKIRANPRKYPDYLQEGGSLYRHLPHRAGSEDVAAWRLCVPRQQRERVLRENHDEPTA